MEGDEERKAGSRLRKTFGSGRSVAAPASIVHSTTVVISKQPVRVVHSTTGLNRNKTDERSDRIGRSEESAKIESEVYHNPE